MANKSLGYHPIWRCLRDHWLWKSPKPFCERCAWIDLLLAVNHKESKVNSGDSVVVVRPGQLWTSYDNLSKNWNWSRQRVYRYINKLKADGMVKAEGTRRGTLLTVINYDKFKVSGNSIRNKNKTSGETSPEILGATSHGTQTIMKKNNIDNAKNEKRKNARTRASFFVGEDDEWQSVDW